MTLLAPLRIWKIRRQQHDQPYSIHLERRAPVRFGRGDTKPYWQYVNHIKTPARVVKLIIGCEATMRDAQGNPRLSEVLEMALEQAAGVLTHPNPE
jgi:hypothetical protein